MTVLLMIRENHIFQIKQLKTRNNSRTFGIFVLFFLNAYPTLNIFYIYVSDSSETFS